MQQWSEEKKDLPWIFYLLVAVVMLSYVNGLNSKAILQTDVSFRIFYFLRFITNMKMAIGNEIYLNAPQAWEHI